MAQGRLDEALEELDGLTKATPPLAAPLHQGQEEEEEEDAIGDAPVMASVSSGARRGKRREDAGAGKGARARMSRLSKRNPEERSATWHTRTEEGRSLGFAPGVREQ